MSYKSGLGQDEDLYSTLEYDVYGEEGRPIYGPSYPTADNSGSSTIWDSVGGFVSRLFSAAPQIATAVKIGQGGASPVRTASGQYYYPSSSGISGSTLLLIGGGLLLLMAVKK